MHNPGYFNTLSPGQNGHHFTDDIFKCIFLNENVWISIKISLNFVPKGPGDKPLSEPMMVSLLTHICVTRPQWVDSVCHLCYYAVFFKRLDESVHLSKPFRTSTFYVLNCFGYMYLYLTVFFHNAHNPYTNQSQDICQSDNAQDTFGTKTSSPAMWPIPVEIPLMFCP